MVMTNERKIEILKEARDLIDFHGLSHGIFMEPNGCLCTQGAIIKALNPDKELRCNWIEQGMPLQNEEDSFSNYFTKEVDELTEVMAKVMAAKEKGYEGVYTINDRSTKEEVLSYFDQAIVYLS